MVKKFINGLTQLYTKLCVKLSFTKLFINETMSLRVKRKLQNDSDDDNLVDDKCKKKMTENFQNSTLKRGKSEIYNDSEYYIDNGLRKVYSYYYTYSSYCKRRWIGKKLIDIYAKEFRAMAFDKICSRIEMGLLCVNSKTVDVNYVLKDNDLITNYMHRHELPVIASRLSIIHMSDEMLVIDKPPSIPIHPCGRYRHNTITTILMKEHDMQNLHIIHRLDRLTSGILLFARTVEKSREIDEQIRSRTVSKEYVCRVRGNFPDEEIICDQSISVLSYKIGICVVSPNGRDCSTIFKKINYNGKSSAVLCKPLTGRMHQIRVHLQYLGFPIIGDSLYDCNSFGPLKGKDGDYGGKSMEKLLEDITKNHSIENWLDPGFVPIRSSEVTIENEMALKALSHYSNHENIMSLQQKYQFDNNKLILEDDCDDCHRKCLDPEPRHLLLYLHALRYKGKGWEFETEMPLWAKDDWDY